MDNIAFSVLMPVYFKEDPDNFRSAIESVLKQTLLPSEIVIVEDGPLTKELDIEILNYTNKYPTLFTIIKLPVNCGMGIAMNEGLNACKFNWIARMDSDDLSIFDRFEKQINFLKQHPEIDVIGGWIEEFRHTPGDMKQIRNLPEKHAEIYKFAKTRNPMNHMTVMFNKDKALKSGGYWQHRILEDYHLWFQMFQNSCKFYNIQEILVNARVGNNMLGRRKGMPYFRMEVYFFNVLYKSKFITKYQLGKVLMERGLMKIIPIRFLERIYAIMLRTKN